MAVLSDIFRSLGVYLKAWVENAIIVVLLYVIACAITGVPWWLVTGLFCGFLNLIPHLGPLLALGVALYLKFLTSQGMLPLAYVGVAWLAIQIADGFYLGPRAAGRAGVNPLLSIAITLAAGFMLGPIGMLLAVPVLVVVNIVVRTVRASKRLP